MQVLKAPTREAEGTHITTFRALERHCRDQAKQIGYEKLLVDFGVDLGRFAKLTQHPRLVIAEQPGCWFYSDDVLRYHHLRHLIDTLSFHDSSGVVTLGNDSLSCGGPKRFFYVLSLHRELGPVSFLGSAALRRYKGRIFHALPISGSVHERTAEVLELSLRLLDAAAISPDVFAEEMLGVFHAGIRRGLRPLLPQRTKRGALRAFGSRLADCDLVAARRPLALASRLLADEMNWTDFWNLTNEAFLDTRIAGLETLFNQFILAVEDPLRMSRRLIKECAHRPYQPIAVASIIDSDNKYRIVYFDPMEERFFYLVRACYRQSITWREIRELAEMGRTGGPAAVLEYLMMAASGMYLLVEPIDGYKRFETKAREIHRRYTGLCYPYVTFSSPEFLSEPDITDSYLAVYSPDFAIRSRTALDQFFS